ncbi:MAG: hypothetical protein FWD53_12785 [Phycisphaerales bacterium]|nr:hypothetical protein [Phycisphaerales bacterium]
MAWMLWALVLVCAGSVRGQGSGGSGVSGYATSMTTITPGAWTTLDGRVINTTNEPLDAMMVVAEIANRDVQFTRWVWVPAKSTLKFPMPFMTTGGDDVKYHHSFDTEVRVVAGIGGGVERDLWKGSHPLRVDDGDSPTGMYWEQGVNGPSDLVMQLRSAVQRKGRLASFEGRNRPFSSGVLGLASVPDLVIATSSELSVSQALAVRQWLVQGGRLWIMADRVRPEVARLILGGEWTYEVAQETELATVRLKPRQDAEVVSGPYESPIRMVRMVGGGWEVTHTIDGWPAIMWRKVGDGQLLVTTFDIPGMELAEKAEPQWSRDLMERFLAPMRALPPGAVGG